MIIYISDFDLRGSGYMNISVALCKEMAAAGLEVKALGISYKGQEHNFPMSIIPIPAAGAVQSAMQALDNLVRMNVKIDCVIVALDIPLHEGFLSVPRRNIPYIGIFPIESGPVCRTWAQLLMKMDDRLIISEFGRDAAEAAGVPAKHLPVGLDLEAWRPPTELERAKIRMSMGFEDDEMIVLTVADNHERKNLSAAFQMVARAREKGLKLRFCLVSRIDFRSGYLVNDLAASFKIADIFMPFERGLPFEKLWGLFAASDVFLLTSKAEGLGMPLLEAMACKIPVIATDCTAIHDHLKNRRGLLIQPDYEFVDPWGNSQRFYPSITLGADRLAELSKMNVDQRTQMIERAYEYAKARTWENAGKVLIESITALTAERAKLEETSLPIPNVDIY